MFSDPARMRADRRKAVEPRYIAGTEPKWTERHTRPDACNACGATGIPLVDLAFVEGCGPLCRTCRDTAWTLPPCALCGTRPDHQHGPYPLWYLAALLANRRRIIMADSPGASVGGL